MGSGDENDKAWVRNCILATVAHAQQRSYSIYAESFSSMPKPSKRKKDTAEALWAFAINEIVNF